ncbi:hypothetical protein ACKWTF_014626 [Chironomus riparius]
MLSYVKNGENEYASRYPVKVRDCTNLPFLLLCMLLVLVSLILVGYCIIFGNLGRFDKVLDDCKNFCGQLNDDNLYDCGPKDLRHYPYLHIEYELYDIETLTIKPIRKCVDNCPKNFSIVLNKCRETNKTDDDEEAQDPKLFDVQLKTEFSRNVGIFLENVTTYRDAIATVCLFAVFFSYVLLIFFRFIAKYLIWIICVAVILFVFILAGISVLMWNSQAAVILMTIGIILGGILAWLRTKIGLVAKIFKESSKIMVDIPAVIFGPLLTFTTFIAAFKIFITFAAIIHNSADVHRTLNDNGTISIYFEELPIAVVAQTFNIITFIWFTQFILSCQHFVVAAIICKWFFIRDKEKLERPIKSSFKDLKRGHLGSVCLGSLLIAIMKVLRVGFRPFRKSNKKPSTSCNILRPLALLDEFLHYPSRTAFIITAKNATPFFQAGKRAYLLQLRNLRKLMILIDFGELVFLVCRVLIVLAAGTFGYEILVLSSPGACQTIPLTIGATFAFFIAHSFMTFYEMTIEAILVCFCIDCEENDGAANPYFMADSLKRIMVEINDEMGGSLAFGEKVDGGLADGSNIPMLSKFTRPN